jgi:hypothetical protein
MTVYRTLLRPVSQFTLPEGTIWEYVTAPAEIAPYRPDLPVSDHRYGTFKTMVPLTPEQLEHFSIEVVS